MMDPHYDIAEAKRRASSLSRSAEYPATWYGKIFYWIILIGWGIPAYIIGLGIGLLLPLFILGVIIFAIFQSIAS
jgi:hypothetical protein